MSTLTAGLIGVTHPHSLAHLRTLQNLPEVTEIVLWDESAEALAAVQESHPTKVTAAYTDLDAFLGRGDLFCAIAALRNDVSPGLSVRTVNAGIHLMAEKPIGRTAAEVQQVVEAAARANVKLSVCYQNRRNPLIQQAREHLRRGLLGQLMTLELRMLTTQVQFRNPSHWLFSKEKAGGGMLSWLGCHYIDMMRYLTGDEVVSVSAEVATNSGEQIDVEDSALVTLRFRSGAIGSLHAAYVMALSGGGYHNRQGYDTYVGFNGRKGRMYWSSSGTPNQLHVESTDPSWAGAPQQRQEFTMAESTSYGGVSGEQFIRDFILAAQGEGQLVTSGNDALQVARIVDAAYASSASGRRIDLA